MRAHCWLQWEAKRPELSWMLLLTQGLIHRDVHCEVEVKLLHRGKDKVTVTCSYLDPVVFVYSTDWHTHSVKPHTPPDCEELQNESPELLYSWQAAHYRRNTENLTFLHSVQSDQLLKRRTKRNTFYFWFCFQSGFNATNCIDIQSFLHVSNECLLVADGSFYMLDELDLSLSGVGIIL